MTPNNSHNDCEAPDLILLNAGRADNNANWNWENVISPFARIYYVREGSARLFMHNEYLQLRSDNLYLIPPFTEHTCVCDGFFSHYYIHIYEKASTKIPIMNRYRFPFESQGDRMSKSLVERLLEINPGRELQQTNPAIYDNSSTLLNSITKSATSPYYRQVETHGLLCMLFSHFLAKAEPRYEMQDERLAKVIGYISQNINESISLSTLSEISQCTEDHLIRIFKRRVDYTPFEYINLRKIEKAQFMIMMGEASINEIADELSFCNASYFCKKFKDQTGMTPLEYRRKNRTDH